MLESQKILQSRYFNSHPHEEDDPRLLLCELEFQYFNSHPHEEDDVFQLKSLQSIMTFQLTSSRGG